MGHKFTIGQHVSFSEVVVPQQQWHEPTTVEHTGTLWERAKGQRWFVIDIDGVRGTWQAIHHSKLRPR